MELEPAVKSRTQEIVYRIADLQLILVFPGNLESAKILPSFESFKLTDATSDEIISVVEFRLGAMPEKQNGGTLLSDISIEWNDRFRFYEQEQAYLTTIWNEDKNGIWKMKSTKDFSHSVIYFDGNPLVIGNALSWLIMVAFGQSCLLYQTILIHASVINCAGKGYAFLGKSGTGKSTHSRMWLQSMQDTKLLNDDNPAVKVELNGEVKIYGTPWSGKTACYENQQIPLEAFVRLRQAKFNQISVKKWTAAFVSVLPSCTAIRWNKELFYQMNTTLEKILTKVIVAELDCLPEHQAAIYCRQELELMITSNLKNYEITIPYENKTT